jgi:thiol-disulfide isomerase/thioredoxin
MKKILFLLSAVLLTSFGGFAGNNFVTFTANIANRNGDAIFIQRGQSVIKKIQVNKDGVFKDTLKVVDGFYEFFDGVEYTELYLKNGYDLKMKMDAKIFDESMTYTGTGSDENNYLAQSIRDQASLGEQVSNLKAEDALKFLSDKNNEAIAKLEKGKFDKEFVAQRTELIAADSQQMEVYFQQKMANAKMNNAASPAFDYENHKGGKTKLADFKGKYVYIDTWATWCGPCRAEIPFLQKAEEKYKGKNIEFVSISVDVKKDYEKWKKFVTDKNLGGTQLFADNDWNSEFIKAYGINSIPRFILIDPKGNVIDADAKRPSDPGLLTQLDALVK